MIEFRDILPEMNELVQETERRANVRNLQLQIALAQANMPEEQWNEQLARIWAAKTPWLTALPLSRTSSALPAVDSATSPAVYTAIACDGSQIPLDRNEIAPCYLLNVGRVAIHYGTRERPLLDAQAKLFYRDQDLLININEQDEAGSQVRSYVTERELATRRFLGEMEKLGELIEQFSGRRNVVAFVDGTLILWAQEAEAKVQRKEALEKFLKVMEHAKACRTPIIGYLSRPASREVIGGLRVTLCPYETVDCKQSPHTDLGALPCSGLDLITDADLFSQILEPGQRSGLYLSSSHVLDSYKPADQRIAFAYINTGSEISRLEMPRWVAEDEAMLDLCHSVTVDQAKKGHGYPICLAEAHEQAVVRAPERAAFFELIERALLNNGTRASRSLKAVSKRQRIV